MDFFQEIIVKFKPQSEYSIQRLNSYQKFNSFCVAIPFVYFRRVPQAKFGKQNPSISEQMHQSWKRNPFWSVWKMERVENELLCETRWNEIKIWNFEAEKWVQNASFIKHFLANSRHLIHISTIFRCRFSYCLWTVSCSTLAVGFLKSNQNTFWSTRSFICT